MHSPPAAVRRRWLRLPAALGLGALALGAAAWFGFGPGPSPPGRAAAPARDRPAAPAAAAAAAGPAGLAAEGTVHLLRMPDGSRVPPLNGVTIAKDPAELWEAGRPYAPIVGTKVVNGIEYYVHADGSTTTTLRVWRPDLGRYDGATQVVNPKAPQQMPAGERPGAAQAPGRH